MFDWDKHQESLVAGPSPTATPQGSPRAQASRFRKLGGLTLLVALAAGWVYEKDLVAPFRTSSALDIFVFEAFAPRPGGVVLPTDLVVHDEAQARAFLHGLRAAKSEDLARLSSHLVRDMAGSGAALSPYYQDAQRLIALETARRGASPAS